MVTLTRTNNNHPDFKNLVKALDADLLERYGPKQAAYAPHNILDIIETAVLVYDDGIPAGCACFKGFDGNSVEIKRMYVTPKSRGKHIAYLMLTELENWAKELSNAHTVLETGLAQPEAIGLYQKAGYTIIENYGPYINMSDSVCMKKAL
jgi:putative acetyltransferase